MPDCAHTHVIKPSVVVSEQLTMLSVRSLHIWNRLIQVVEAVEIGHSPPREGKGGKSVSVGRKNGQ